MATITRRKAGYQVQIRRKGFPAVSKCFAMRRDAEGWARRVEHELDRGIFIDRTEADKQTLGDILCRYAAEVSPSHKGRKTEEITIAALRRQQICQLRASALSAKALAEWRDGRLKSVSGGTVNRELNLISAAINLARKEWGVHIENPVALVRRPAHGKARTRRLTSDEEVRLLGALAPTPRRQNGTFDSACRNHWIQPLVLLALETAMRQGELLGLRWTDVDTDKRVALLRDTKNGEARSVPLSSRALMVFQTLPRSIDGRVFPLEANAAKKAFTRACKRAALTDFRFHDLRHEAVSRLFERGLNPFEVAAVSGHKGLAMLKRYTHLRASELAKKLG